ncbi:type VI secretion system Vgr family protein [Chondromyces crocatus]|uniref:Gp5/Type VI secretion system Vgr protein OB-fold domain-containing protein n=1 Tax=Chondromyces crocatus TaxID=52 RepID=A0A0K1EP70_CHOCO|nr:type VI secretion system tip protein TssI/VgrG [Chondromyces crocatus]AKT42710.1 uncharacterized protein CMC5_069370 [Chondromyces crocatus]
MKDVFTISSSVLPLSTRVMGFRGTEALSTPYQLDILLMTTHDAGSELDLADAIGAKATLTLDHEDGRPPFTFCGVFSAMELVQEVGGRAVFRATLVPQLWQLGLTYHSRIFTKLSIPDIIRAIFDDNGLSGSDYELRLIGQYPPEEHVCQYRESDLDFVSRWMEREGMYYFFEHGEDGEKLVITDHKSFHAPLAQKPIRFHPQSGADVTAGESFRAFTCRHTSLPASVRLRDYDYGKPALEVAGTAAVSPTGFGDVSVYGMRFFTPADGKRLATLRAEELLARQTIAQGMGAAWYLRSGYTFELEDHPRPSLNRHYLATSLEHFGNQTHGSPELKELLGHDVEDVYRVAVAAVATDVQFRAERRTVWPRIDGFENAIVDGPTNSEYAQIDEHGRYALKLQFDESANDRGKATTWVRMLQPHGGSVEGWHFPLRNGTEVVCIFLGGDPDRPVIAGVAPNATTPSPVTSGNNTQNVIQTGGSNRIQMEDRAGSQQIITTTPTQNTQLSMGAPHKGHNVALMTDGSSFHHSGQHLNVEVGDYKTEVVQGAVTEVYNDTVTEVFQGPYGTTVTLDVTETYLANKTESVPSGHVEEFYQSQTTTVTNLRKSEYGTQDTHVKGTVDEVYDGTHTTTVTAGGRTETVTGLYSVTANDGMEVTVSGGLTNHTLNDGLEVNVTGNAVQTADDTWTVRGSNATRIEGTKAVVITGSDTVTIGEKAITVNGSEVISLNSAKIEILGGDITISGGAVTITGSAATKVEGAPVDITAQGNVTVTGGLVKLNC